MCWQARSSCASRGSKPVAAPAPALQLHTGFPRAQRSALAARPCWLQVLSCPAGLRCQAWCSGCHCRAALRPRRPAADGSWPRPA
jgi:hypothetical protein